ncbi:MAG TPA: BCD family MFS transporter [Polyangiaceae bacterium LLY-WYZ-14_1]|nr:BCD family MFS transporter [Polyangiaceae bacterium LLY-WYZ-14_1]
MIGQLKERAGGLWSGSFWTAVGPRLLPFADAATPELPLGRLLRLALFQVSVGIAVVLLNGTLNRVMIVELGIPAALVAAMVALPILFAPMRALIGYRSDHHRSVLGWRRVPYVWMGTLVQFGGLAILPFALLVLSGRGFLVIPFVGEAAAALAFLMVGAGLHITQTAGVALATDLAPRDSRPRVVALLYVMLLVGMVGASLSFGVLLQSFGYVKLIQVIQGAAVVTIVLNLVALWKQEPRGLFASSRVDVAPDVADPREAEASGETAANTVSAASAEEPASFREAFRGLLSGGDTARLLVAVGLGGAGFSMQDILLEPYGGELLALSVSATTLLTAMMAAGTLVGLFVAARWLSRNGDPYRLAALGVLVGIGGFSGVIFASPLSSLTLFWAGTALIGFGGGWFSVGTLTASMGLSSRGQNGLAIGAWGAVQATVTGLGVGAGGGLRDAISGLAVRGALGPGLTDASVGYSFVYHIEIALLFGTLIAIGPLVRSGTGHQDRSPARFGLAELPN